MSKSFLANMDSNPLVQSGGVKGSFCVSEDQWAPSASFWEIVEVAHRSSVVDSVRGQHYDCLDNLVGCISTSIPTDPWSLQSIVPFPLVQVCPSVLYSHIW